MLPIPFLVRNFFFFLRFLMLRAKNVSTSMEHFPFCADMGKKRATNRYHRCSMHEECTDKTSNKWYFRWYNMATVQKFAEHYKNLSPNDIKWKWNSTEKSACSQNSIYGIKSRTNSSKLSFRFCHAHGSCSSFVPIMSLHRVSGDNFVETGKL